MPGILAIRLQALGDVVITLPYLRALKAALPGTALDFVTRAQDAELARGVDIFDRVHVIGGGQSERQQLLRAPLLGTALFARRYNAVIDLQNNRVSRLLTRMAAARTTAHFDRDSPISAGERTRRTIEAAGFPLDDPAAGVPLKDRTLGLRLRQQFFGATPPPIIVLSPAGAFVTRNWPLERYADFAERWLARRPAVFTVIGMDKIAAKAAQLKDRLGSALVDLTGRTTSLQALALVQQASLVLTEDCGLMHMAWTSGTPTLALFGASRHFWSAPLGPHSRCLHSGDLECGACYEPTCRFGDVHCLTRYSVERVLAEAESLMIHE